MLNSVFAISMSLLYTLFAKLYSLYSSDPENYFFLVFLPIKLNLFAHFLMSYLWLYTLNV